MSNQLKMKQLKMNIKKKAKNKRKKGLVMIKKTQAKLGKYNNI